MEPTAFVAACVVLLATPGPTNTLLATSGAAVGVRRSLPLLAAELLGYLSAITLLRVVVGPVMAAAPLFATLLRVVVVAYLLVLAVKLWRHGAADLGRPTLITSARVFATTLLNPKSIIFAFTILPPSAGLGEIGPWLAALGTLIAVIGAAWIAIGAGLRHGLREIVAPGLGYRLSAVVLALLAGVVGAHAFT